MHRLALISSFFFATLTPFAYAQDSSPENLRNEKIEASLRITASDSSLIALRLAFPTSENLFVGAFVGQRTYASIDNSSNEYSSASGNDFGLFLNPRRALSDSVDFSLSGALEYNAYSKWKDADPKFTEKSGHIVLALEGGFKLYPGDMTVDFGAQYRQSFLSGKVRTVGSTQLRRYEPGTYFGIGYRF